MLLQKLYDKKLIQPPKFLLSNTQALYYMGSAAYGVNSDLSDMDVYGWCVPPKKELFPHLNGEIIGFGRQRKRFEQYQQHHILDTDGKTEYDVSVYNIVKYFNLAMEGNPNIIDSLFVDDTCILHSTPIFHKVRDNRHLFLSKVIWHKFKGYAYSQLHKASSKQAQPGSKRAALREKYGEDTKFLYHVVRLMSEVEQILSTGDLDLKEKGRREHMKAVRRGEVSREDVCQWFSTKEKTLEQLYANSKLPYSPRESEIKNLLLECLEMHYQSLDDVITVEDKYEQVVNQIKTLLDSVQ